MDYTPHTEQEIAKALAVIGVDSLAALFADLPEALRSPAIDLPAGLDEVALLAHLRALAAKNRAEGPNFLGGGAQRHFIPAVTAHLAMQSEFVTAYTPYQAEVAQGVLQATFEYQTMMAELTGLPVSNASMYDGASAVAEAAILAMRQTGRRKVLVSQGVHPESREVLATYLHAIAAEIITVTLADLATPVVAVSEDAACLIVQNPNYLGYLEPMAALAEAAHAAGALFVAAVEPLSLALLRSPGEVGADIAVGDGQTIGNPLNLGGPSFGFMVVKEDLLRQLPGRLVGQTQDVEGKRAFVLTLQAREQHIRRSKAKSNICSNHQLTALMAAVNLAALGPAGLRELATASVARAHQLADALREAGFAALTDRPFFNEFVLPVPLEPAGQGFARPFRRLLAERGIHAGVPVPPEYGLGHAVLLSASELTSDQEIAALVTALREIQARARPLKIAHD